jgi:hypothetical protein
VCQAQKALQVLFREYLPLPWARLWPLPARALEAARGLSQGTTFRDEVRSHAVEAWHQAVLSRLRTARCARHYALRTARASERWIRGFVLFRSLKSPQKLRPEAVKEDSKYLAQACQGLAST